jgi:putative glycerol-1-phosphate prenyltransferase
LNNICIKANHAHVDLIFVGGSYMSSGNIEDCILEIKKHTTIPVIIFPGSVMQISKHADAILFLSLISGRNADLLIGTQVLSAPIIKQVELEPIATGYMLIESGNITTAHYLSGSMPIPRTKNDLAAGTALAAQMLGMQCVYMDAGSGAQQFIPPEMIKAVRSQVDIPIIVGGGITTPEIAKQQCTAGADIVVVGSAVENDVNLIGRIKSAINSL